jgi:hypothetical protein
MRNKKAGFWGWDTFANVGATLRRILRISGPLAIGVVGLWPGSVRAQTPEPPHWSNKSFEISCTSTCHLLHQAQGGGLTAHASNVNLCQSCHWPGGDAWDRSINNMDKAVPHVGGTSHAFDVDAVNAGLDTQNPQDAEMLVRVMGGKIVCSTCHNQHKGEQSFGGTSRVRPTQKVTTSGSQGAVTPGGTFTGPEGVWYLIEITTDGDETTAEFRYSKDNGISWVLEGLTAGADVALDSGVTVTFTNGGAPPHFVAGEQWEFAAAWPFLRANLDSGDNNSANKYCRDCHRSWVMTHTETQTYDGSYKSHPVGVALNDNSQGYDRGTPLDGDGLAQPSAPDNNPTNDLQLDGTFVQCLTCHGVHYADSNTKTVDVQ